MGIWCCCIDCVGEAPEPPPDMPMPYPPQMSEEQIIALEKQAEEEDPTNKLEEDHADKLE